MLKDLKKITWPSKAKAINEAKVDIFISLAVGALIFELDLLLKFIIGLAF